jgi:RNA polymerase primary sigma factor
MARLQSEIRATGYRVALLDAFEAHSAAAGTLRQILVRSNLRLVVSIAKRHIGPVMGLFDLISEGNICLMRAVECFDFSRGTRFSTYATWALTKHFARAVPEANYRLSAFVTGQEELIERYGDPREQPSATEEKLAHIKTIISGAVEQLLPRERAVIEARFGTAGQKPHTLQELAALFGLTRERIRQIEARALLRLREHLGPEAADTAGI